MPAISALPEPHLEGAVERTRDKEWIEGVDADGEVRLHLPCHRTVAVSKYYNIVEEQDLKAAVPVPNQIRRAAEDARSASGKN